MEYNRLHRELLGEYVGLPSRLSPSAAAELSTTFEAFLIKHDLEVLLCFTAYGFSAQVMCHPRCYWYEYRRKQPYVVLFCGGKPLSPDTPFGAAATKSKRKGALTFRCNNLPVASIKYGRLYLYRNAIVRVGIK